MTIEEVNELLRQIEKYADSGDYEAAHALEDLLFTSVLRTVAEQGNELAKLALTSNKKKH